MRRVIFAIPGDLRTLTGGYGYDRKIIAHLPQMRVAVEHVELAASYPFPSGADLADSVAAINAGRNGDVVMIDGLAFGAMPADVVRAIGSPLVALIHHPVGLEAGLGADDRARLIATERAALALADHVVVNSSATRETLVGNFGVEPSRISVAEPGTDRAERALGSADGSVQLLAVGAIVPRKGYDVLVDALAQVADLDWRLRIIGSFARDRTASDDLRAQIDRLGLQDRIELAGERAAAALEPLFQATDIFVMASHYEGYGMALAEALARGLPIVTTTGGAAADTVPDAAALKVPPGNPDAFAAALRKAIPDRVLRRQLSDESWRAAQSLPTWENAARVIADAIERAASKGRT